MSLASQITALSTRIGQECKALWTAVNGKAPSSHSHTVPVQPAAPTSAGTGFLWYDSDDNSGSGPYEPVIAAGTTAQYLRGDKTWQTLDKTTVGLSAVDNTSDAAKNAAAATLTNKSLALGSNTVTGTRAQFDGAVTDGDFSYVGHTHTKANITDFAHTHAQADVANLANDLAAKAPVDNPTFTGTATAPKVEVTNVVIEKSATASGTSGTVTLDVSAAGWYTLTPTAAVTALALSGPPASGKVCTVNLEVSQGATPYTIATPTGGIFVGAASPTQVANKKCIFTYVTRDGGTTWLCSAAVQV